MTSQSTNRAAATVAHMYVYPVKGLSPQRVDDVVLRPGACFPGDRVLALARPDGTYREGSTDRFPPTEFFRLARDARLAGIRTRLDSSTGVLEASVQGHVVLRCDVGTPEGREQMAQFYARVLDLAPGQRPVVARAVRQRFTDAALFSDELMNAVSLINLESVRELERRSGVTLDPRRFRANVYVEGMPPFRERALVGQDLEVGEVLLHVVLNTRRCAATTVNPDTADRDVDVPRLLMEHYGHADLGVYATVMGGGRITEGSSVVPRGDR